jgi:phosphatidylglycerophosphate synthase
MPHVPAWISSRQLTLLTALWSVLVWLGCYLGVQNRQWLWLSTAAIVCQYLSDALDGKIGQLRNDGFVRWGHYMDHLLDYVFMAAIFSGYAELLPPDSRHLMIWATVIGGAFMASAFLEHGAAGRMPLNVGRLGPTEMRLVFIAINLVIITGGNMAFRRAIPWALGGALVVLVRSVSRIQQRLAHEDRETTRSA